jgi:hypothetical protein
VRGDEPLLVSAINTFASGAPALESYSLYAAAGTWRHKGERDLPSDTTAHRASSSGGSVRGRWRSVPVSASLAPGCAHARLHAGRGGAVEKTSEEDHGAFGAVRLALRPGLLVRPGVVTALYVHNAAHCSAVGYRILDNTGCQWQPGSLTTSAESLPVELRTGTFSHVAPHPFPPRPRLHGHLRARRMSGTGALLVHGRLRLLFRRLT